MLLPLRWWYCYVSMVLDGRVESAQEFQTERGFSDKIFTESRAAYEHFDGQTN
jgi:hypothetical protein